MRRRDDLTIIALLRLPGIPLKASGFNAGGCAARASLAARCFPARKVARKSRVSGPWYAEIGSFTSSSRRRCVRSLREPGLVANDAETIRLPLMRYRCPVTPAHYPDLM